MLLEELKKRDAREWYLRADLECRWSRNVLVLQIKSWLREGKGRPSPIFRARFEPTDSDLAEKVLKDP